MALTVTDDLKAAAVSHEGSMPVARLDVFPVSGSAAESKGLKREIFDLHYPAVDDSTGSGDRLWTDMTSLMAFNWGQSMPLGISPQQLTDGKTWSMKWTGYFKCQRPTGFSGTVNFSFGYIATGYVLFQVDGSTKASGPSPHSVKDIAFQIPLNGEELWIPITIWYSRSDGTDRLLTEERFVMFWKDEVDDAWRIFGADRTCLPDGRYTNISGTPVSGLGIDPQYANNDRYTLNIHKVGSAYHFHTSTDTTTAYSLSPGQDTRLTPYNITGDFIGILWNDTISNGDAVEIDVVRNNELPWEIPVTDMAVDMAADGASTLNISVPVTTVAFDERNVDRTNFSTYDLNTDSFGVLRPNRLVKAYFGYIVDGSPEWVQRFTGLIQDISPEHTTDGDSPSIKLDVTCIDARVKALDPPVTKIEDMELGALPNQLSYDMVQLFPGETSLLGGDGSVRPVAFDRWNLTNVVRAVLYQSGFMSEQLWAKDSNGNFLIDDRSVYLEKTLAYPFSIFSILGAQSAKENIYIEPNIRRSRSLTVSHIDQGFVEMDVENAQVKDMPYLYTFPLDTVPWEALRDLCDSYGLDLGLNNEGSVYMRYPNNPVLSSATIAIGSNILAESAFGTHAAWDVTGDWDDSGNNAEYEWTSNQTSVLRQTAAKRLNAGEGETLYTFTYTVIAVSTVPDGDFALTLEYFSDSPVSLPYTLGTHSISFFSHSAAATANFDIIATSTTATEGRFFIDNVTCGAEDETRSVSYGIGWEVLDEPEALGNVQGHTDTNGALLLIKFTGIGIDLVFTRTQADSKAIVYVDEVIVDGVNELDSNTGDKGHVDWTDNVNSPDVDVTLALDSLADGVDFWYFANGIHSNEGENPTVFTICDNLTYGEHNVVIQQSSGDVYFEGFRVIRTSTEQPQHEFDAKTDIIGVQIDESLEALTNDVIVAGNMQGVASEYVTARAVDLSSIGNEVSPNYIGVRKPWYISDPRITNQERADFLAQHLLLKYRRGQRTPVLETIGLPWLEPRDPVSIRDIQLLSDNSTLPVLGLYSSSDLTPAQRTGVGGILPVPFQHYWITEISEKFSVQNDIPDYKMSVTTTGFPPLPAYEPLPEPIQDESSTPISDISIAHDNATYNPFLSHSESAFVDIGFSLNWHADTLVVRILTGETISRTTIGMDVLRPSTVVNILLAKTGFISAGKYTLQWDGWIETGDGGHYAPDGVYVLEIETQRHSTGAGFKCRAETGFPGVVVGSKSYIDVVLDRDAAYGASPFSVTVSPSSSQSSPALVYDLELNGGSGIQIDVTLLAPAQVIIPFTIKFMNRETPPVNQGVTNFSNTETWIQYLTDRNSPVLEAGSYTFYFNPALHILRSTRPVIPFGGVVNMGAQFGVSYVGNFQIVTKPPEGYSVGHDMTDYLEKQNAWYVAWHMELSDGNPGVIFRDLSGVEERPAISEGTWFNWGGPRANTYLIKVDRNDVDTYYKFVFTKA